MFPQSNANRPVGSTPKPSRKSQFHKRSQLFIRTQNETLSVVAMCVCNPHRSPITIHG
jgi:hypothetical protein